MVRGLNRQNIFRDARDREDFIERLEDVSSNTSLQILAWSLLSNHLHLVVRTGARPLSAAMRKLLTGYATKFNLRHARTGHVFQNRYKSIVVEEEPYLLELVRYVHLNPLRAGEVETMDGLDRHPWAGHSAIMGRVARPWQAVDQVLQLYAGRATAARRAYRAFVQQGVTRGRRPELQGGGLIRSAGGWEAVAELRRGREAWVADERVLGSSEFVLQVMQESQGFVRPLSLPSFGSLPLLVERVADRHGLSVAECCRGGRRRQIVAARNDICFLAVAGLGLPAAQVARALGVSPQSAGRGVDRRRTLSEQHRDELMHLLKGLE